MSSAGSINNCLSTLGLSRSEQEVVIFLLEVRSEWPVSALTRELEMPRQTINSICQSLRKRGAILHQSIKGVPHFSCNIKQLSDFAEAQITHLKDAITCLETQYAQK